MNDLFLRAAKLYCDKKGINPNEIIGWHSNIDIIAMQLEEMELKMYCLRQAEDTKGNV